MRVIDAIAELRVARARLTTFGFVPTMGYLHEGHLTLVRAARRDNEAVAASIFVNPTQFGQNEDFATYPRDLQRDLALLEREGVDVVFAPSVEEMYPEGYATRIDVGDVGQPLEGAHRPGHFAAVATVVAKLFNIVTPTKAYFGEKDGQQVRVIKKMVRDLDFGLEIVVVPTVREADGLAMSSRNVYLGPAERAAATVLSRSLELARSRYDSGERSAQRIRDAMIELIRNEPLAKVDYVSIADSVSLEELQTIDRPALVSLAVRFGRTRLIDNTSFE